MNEDNTLRWLQQLQKRGLQNTKILLIDIVGNSLNGENRF